MMNLMQRAIYPCAKIREFTFGYLEGDLPPSTRVRFRMHLMGCRNCREFVRLYRIAANPERFLAENPIPDDMMEHTLAFLEKELGSEGVRAEENEKSVNIRD